MKRLVTCLISGLFLTLPLLLGGQSASAAAGADQMHRATVLEFETMVGVDGPFLGPINPIRGINGGGLPWILEEGEGSLRADGKLTIKVRGLIIPDTAPSAVAGTNPAPFFLAAVSCMTTDAEMNIMVKNVFTTQEETRMLGDPKKGNANIRAMVTLPQPCIAPIIFVTSPGQAWFAVTGH
jgi:hypothetical protein